MSLNKSYFDQIDKNSNIDFLPTLISEKKFINVFNNLTIFVDKYNYNGIIDNYD